MNKTLIVLFSLLLLYCCNEKASYKEANNSNSTKDSTLYFYKRSKNKQLSKTERLNAINNAFKNKKNDSLALKIINKKILLHLSLKQHDSFFHYNTHLLKQAKALKDEFYLGKHHYLKAYYYHTITNLYDSAFYHYNLSKTHFKTIADSSQIGKQFLNMALIQQNKSDYIGSKESITEAIKYLHPKKQHKYLASAYSVLASNHRMLLNHDDAINYYRKAILNTRSKKDKIGYQNNLAAVYIDHKKFKHSIRILKTIKEDTILKKDSNQYARIIDNLGYALWLDYSPKGKQLLLKALDLRLKNNDIRGQISSYLHLGDYFLETNTQKSYYYLNKAIKISKQIKSIKGELEALHFLMKLKPQSTTFKDRYISITDSLYKHELKAKTLFAKMKYDDKTKQQTILKLEAEKTKQALIVSKQRTQKTIYLLGGIILVILGIFIFYILKQHHKEEKLKEIYKTETRISQKVHDEVANGVYHIINKMQNSTTQQQDDVLIQLENIYKVTRDISHESSSINLNDHFFYRELNDILSAYQNNKVKISTIGLNKALWTSVNDYKKINILRVIQELMTNMSKHSHATQVVVKFKKEKKRITISYIDNGIGIKKTTPFKLSGLQNVENRIKNIGGNLIFDINRTSGVALNISFPI